MRKGSGTTLTLPLAHTLVMQDAALRDQAMADRAKNYESHQKKTTKSVVLNRQVS